MLKEELFTPYGRLLLAIIVVVALSGILFVVLCMADGQQEAERKWQTIICEMCGTKWNVLPNKPGVIVEPTVEWCHNDGNFCAEGFELLQKSLGGANVDAEWLEHCKQCTGCRCAVFKPEEWHDLIESEGE